MKLSISLVISLVVTLFLSGCGTLSEKQKASLNEVSLRKSIQTAAAYQKITGTQSPGMGTAIPGATGGGLVFALLGEAIDAGVRTYQSSQFKKQYGNSIEQLDANAQRDLSEALEETVLQAVKADAFFGPRLTENARNYFQIKITSYGLERVKREKNQTYFRSAVSVTLSLTDEKNVRLFENLLVSHSDSSHPFDQLVKDKTLVDQLFLESAKRLNAQTKEVLTARLGKTGTTSR